MNDKERVAKHAAALVEDGMLVGLGTGSTANCFIEAMARRCIEDNLHVTAASSSIVSAIRARELGLTLVGLDVLTRLDLYVDGADEVAPDLTLLKGQGADLVREKIMADAADRFLVLVDQSKLVSRIGERFAIPIEVLPFAWQLAKRSIEALGGQGELRRNSKGDGFAVTSHGSLVLDMTFSPDLDIAWLNQRLQAVPGVVEHGIFHELADAVYLAVDGRVEERLAGSR